MANVKFFKGAIPVGYAKYVPGGIYFDETTHEIRVGSGTAESADYKAFGSHVKDAVMKDSVLTISYTDGKANVVLDFSDVASASDVNVSFKTLSDKIAALEAAKPVAGTDIKIGADDNSINVNIKDSITVAGGPLADDTTDNWPSDWKDTAGNRIIPADKSLTDILTGLFLKKENGVVGTPSYTWNPSVGKPTITGVSGNVEVGTVLKPTFTPNSSVSNNTASVTISTTNSAGKSYGYFLNNDSAHKTGNYSQSVSGKVTGTAACTSTWNGTAITSGGNATVKEGTNTLSVSETGLSATVDPFATDVVYASTNTNEKITATKSSVNATGCSSASPKVLSSSASATCNGLYPIYTNGMSVKAGTTTVPVVTASDDSTKLPLVANGEQFGVAFAAQVDGGTGYRILLHSSKKIASAIALNGLTGKYDITQTTKFVKGSSVTKATGATTTTYNVWEYKGTEGSNCVTFTITNA